MMHIKKADKCFAAHFAMTFEHGVLQTGENFMDQMGLFHRCCTMFSPTLRQKGSMSALIRSVSLLAYNSDKDEETQQDAMRRDFENLNIIPNQLVKRGN